MAEDSQTPASANTIIAVVTPQVKLPADTEEDRFRQALEEARRIQAVYVRTRIKYYVGHTKFPKFFFRAAGVLLVLCSSTLPAFATAPQFQYRDRIIAGLSITIAILSGLAAFYRWDITWRGSSNAQVALEQLKGNWELELSRAKNFLAPEERIDHVYKATNDLLANTKSVMGAEAGTFFEGLKLPDKDTTSK